MNLLKMALFGAAITFGLAAAPANAVTVNAGDTVRVDYFLSGTAFDPTIFAQFFVFFNGFGAGESLSVDFYNGAGLAFQDNVTGPFDGVLVQGSSPPPNYYYIFTNLIGTWDITGAAVRQGNFESAGLVTVNPVPIPAALPLLAAGLSAMGFMGWRRKRRAA